MEMRASITNTYCLFQRPGHLIVRLNIRTNRGVKVSPSWKLTVLATKIFCLKRENRPSFACRESLGVVCAVFPPK